MPRRIPGVDPRRAVELASRPVVVLLIALHPWVVAALRHRAVRFPRDRAGHRRGDRRRRGRRAGRRGRRRGPRRLRGRRSPCRRLRRRRHRVRGLPRGRRRGRRILAHRRCPRRGIADDPEVVHPDAFAALVDEVGVAWTLVVGALAVHPQHVAGLPIAEHWRHAVLQGLRQLRVAFVARNGNAHIAGAVHLRDGDLHGLQVALPICRELDRHLEWLRCVDALGTRTVLLPGEVAGAVPRVAATIAAANAPVVVQGVERGVECMLVGLHDVDLVARHSTDIVGIAVVVVA
mmetsp:Transcript_102822/g.296066  ORF Transcript_102822/g.296066 Transcript_102822/m.296066 type:complete len:290 (+) Transcript_102822:1487-2356(+)